jgi:organic hydroperoxide reductase OsmC/OhrA
MSDTAAVDPEEAFVASLSSCHMLWFLSIAAKEGFIINTYIDDAVGEMGRNIDGKLAMTLVTLRPNIEWSAEHQPTHSQVFEMHQQAHEQCFIASSVKTQVLVQPVM